MEELILNDYAGNTNPETEPTPGQFILSTDRSIQRQQLSAQKRAVSTGEKFKANRNMPQTQFKCVTPNKACYSR